MPCEICGHPIGPPVDATEREDADGYVEWFKEKYECESCGAYGWLEHDATASRISEKRYGRLFEGMEPIQV